jgi:hypothetical protein
VGDVFKVPYLRYDQIRAVADRLLAKHHPSHAIPVPIEQIVEF